jgi:hypothetical protein
MHEIWFTDPVPFFSVSAGGDRNQFSTCIARQLKPAILSLFINDFLLIIKSRFILLRHRLCFQFDLMYKVPVAQNCPPLLYPSLLLPKNGRIRPMIGGRSYLAPIRAVNVERYEISARAGANCWIPTEFSRVISAYGWRPSEARSATIRTGPCLRTEN